MSPCPHPLDPLDIEALAAGAGPVVWDQAAGHAAGCPACGAAVREASRLGAELEGLEGAPSLPRDFTERILRLRPFSRSERMRFSLWALPLGVGVAVFAAGILLLGAPLLSGGEQAGLSAALLAPLPALLRALARWAAETIRIAPASLDALASALRQDFTVGLLLLLLLLPASFGLRRAVARARSSR